MPVTHYLPAARSSARLISQVMSEHGLQADAARYVLAESRKGRAWLFVVFDPDYLPQLNPYLGKALPEWVSTALQGRRVRLADRETPRLAVLLSDPTPRRRSLRREPLEVQAF